MLRDVARRLMRELDFMGGAFAGTDLSRSAVHALIEADSCPLTAGDLATLLRLDKPSVSLLRKLIDRDLLTETAGEKDERTKCFYLTAQGRDQVAAIHVDARAKVTGALSKIQWHTSGGGSGRDIPIYQSH